MLRCKSGGGGHNERTVLRNGRYNECGIKGEISSIIRGRFLGAVNKDNAMLEEWYIHGVVVSKDR